MRENEKITQPFEDDAVDMIANGSEPEFIKEVANNELVVDGCWGTKTTKRAQEVLGDSMTGKIENQPYSIRKYLPNAFSSSWDFKTADYDAGSNLIRLLQGKIGSSADGFCGLSTVRKLQLYVGAPITGRLDEETVKAFQEWLNQQ